MHTDVGHRTVGAKVNGRIVPLHYRLRTGDFVEILTSRAVGPRPVARLALARRVVAGAQQDPPVDLTGDPRGDRGARARGARGVAEAAQAAVQEARRVAAARGADPRDGLQEGGGLLRRARLRASSRPARSRTRCSHRLKTSEVAEEELPARPEGARRGRLAGLRDRRGRPRGRARAAREVLHAGSGRHDRRLHLARQGHHDPPRGLPEREGAHAQPRAVHARGVGRRRLAELPRPDRRHVVGSPAAPRGRRADLRRARREHRRVRRPRRGPDGEELVRGRGRRRRLAPRPPERAAKRRRRLRRLPSHARRDCASIALGVSADAAARVRTRMRGAIAADALAVLHELERTDAAASEALAKLDDLSREVERLGAEAHDALAAARAASAGAGGGRGSAHRGRARGGGAPRGACACRGRARRRRGRGRGAYATRFARGISCIRPSGAPRRRRPRSERLAGEAEAAEREAGGPRRPGRELADGRRSFRHRTATRSRSWPAGRRRPARRCSSPVPSSPPSGRR